MKKVFTFLTMLLIVFFSSNMMTSCGSDDDDGGSGGNAVDVSRLIGKQYWMQKDEITNVCNYEVGFLSPYFCFVHKSGRDLDSDGWDRWDLGEKELLYHVSGNKIIIPYDNDGFESEIIMTIVDGRPEGWDLTGPVESRRVSTEQFDAKPGTPDMFGYYSQDNIRKFAEQEANEKVAHGVTAKKRWEEGFFPNPQGGSLRIVDSNTIDRVDEVVDITGPSKKEPAYVYLTQQYNPKSNTGSATYTLYYYFRTDYYVSRHKYVMDGDTLVMSNGRKLIYQNGTLVENEFSFTTSFTKF